MKTDNSGFVYLMVKESSPGYLKVGTTEKKPHLRALELDGTDSPTPSIVIYYVYCESAQELERFTHEKLNKFRVRANREWFKCAPSAGIEAIKSVAASEEIEIFYEKIFDLPVGRTEFVDDSGGEVDEESDELDIENIINEILDSIWFYHDLRQREVEKYKKYLEERKEELHLRKIRGEKGTDSLLSLSISAYGAKMSELRGEFDKSVKFLIEDRKTILGEMAANKLLAFANGVAAGEISKNSSNITDEKIVVKVVDTLIKKQFG
jgi:hypothetical protein